MIYDINVSQLFQDQLRLLPGEQVPLVQSKIKMLLQDPRPIGKNKTPLVGTRDPKRYRIRAGNYRVIYSFDGDAVHLWNVDKRSEVYVKNTTKGFVVVPKQGGEDIIEDDHDLEVEDAQFEVGPDWTFYRNQLKAWNGQPDPEGQSDEGIKGRVTTEIRAATPTPLPQSISYTLLKTLRIPEEFHQTLEACATDVDLIQAISKHGIPGDIVDRVFNVIAEPDYDAVVRQPRKQVREIEDLKRFYDGDLVVFQVALDSVQKQIAKSIASSGGPWLISGAAGSGKSTVLLEAALNTYHAAIKNVHAPRILFTTYTNALVTTLETMLERLSPGSCRHIDVRTVDSVVAKILNTAEAKVERKLDPSLQGMLRPITRDILQDDYQRGSSLAESQVSQSMAGEVINMAPLTNMSWDYLLSEIEEVIVGRNMTERDDYLTAPRRGRRVGLNDVQRMRIWDISEALTRELTWKGWSTYARSPQRAADLLESGAVQDRYDAVFIDEAQDLQPNAIRMLLELARSPEGNVHQLYLSADGNQTIYGSTYSWVSIHPDLKLQGRSRRLNTNHRSTRQIIEAAKAYLQGAELEDDRSAMEHRNVGPIPLAVRGLTTENEVKRIIDFFAAQCGEIRRDIDLCAVLVPSERDGKQIQAAFGRAGIPSRFMARNTVDLTYEGVKIVTRHTAKGLEFPIVALSLTNLAERKASQDDESHEFRMREKRLNHMAMTRAMRSLLVTLPVKSDEDPFDGITELLWAVDSVAL